MQRDIDFAEVADAVGLSTPAYAEKDYYAIHALKCVNQVTSADFHIVFAGGTCLTKAHQLTARMSEDVDLKIVNRHPGELRGNALRQALRGYRRLICDSLLDAGFAFDPDDRTHVSVHKEGHLFRINLDYAPQFEGAGQLRPHIQLEFDLRTPKLDTIVLPAASFASAAHETLPEIPAIQCISFLETAAEKLSALLWRLHAQQTSTGSESVVEDDRLVRHLYDLHMMSDNLDQDEIVRLAAPLIREDADRAGPTFADNPSSACDQVISSLVKDDYYGAQYDEFIQAMVYGERRPTYSESVQYLQILVSQLKQQL